LIRACPNKQCGLDALPTSVLKHCSCILAPLIIRIINPRLATGDFCPHLKQSVKPSLDKDKLSNYRPISNLSVVSQIIERMVKSRLTDHLTANRLFNPVQSAYRKFHSTTQLELFFFHFMITSSMPLVVSKSHYLCVLDLSAAFNTIDHSILLDRLSKWFGLHGAVLNWVKSYRSNRQFQGKCSDQLSGTHHSPYEVPQGTVLGPLLFSLYTTPLSSLISSFSVNHHLYADDTQLFLSFQASDSNENISHLQNTLGAIASWMTSNLLCINSANSAS